MMAANDKKDAKIPVENLQEVNLDDDSDSSSDGEPETWEGDEGGDVLAPKVPAPSPMPIIPSPSPVPAPESTTSGARAQQQPPGSRATIVELPPARGSSNPGFHSPHKGNPSQTGSPTTATTTTTHRKKHHRPVEEDVSSRAAVALAAVAAAATANNTSPSAAAQAARAVAQSFVRGAKGGSNVHNNSLPITNPIMPNPPKSKPIKTVKLALVKEQLLELCDDESTDEGENEEEKGGGGGQASSATATASSRYPFVERLAHGENDAFLQHLLMLAYYRATDEFPTSAELRPTVAIIDDDGNVERAGGLALGNNSEEEGDPDVDLAEEAANALISLWVTMEGAYTSMVSMLPKNPSSSSSSSSSASSPHKSQTSLEDKVLEVPFGAPGTAESSLKDDALSDSCALEMPGNSSPKHEDSIFDDLDRPVVVPDLLPPCTSARGDVTLEFFRACQGKVEKTEKDKSSSGNTEDESESSEKAKDTTESTAARSKVPPSLGGSATAVFSNMFSAARRNSGGASAGSNFMNGTGGIMNNMKMPAGGFNVFRKNSRNIKVGSSDSAGKRTSSGQNESNTRPGEYTVQIEREMLGLTVENVLERTVVRTVLAGGPAKKAGAKVGSLIVKVGSVETKNLTHFETIDELRQSQRPLQLVLKLISDDALRSAREEMGRLIRGSGFGVITNGSSDQQLPSMAPDNPRGNGKDKTSASNSQGAAKHQRKRGDPGEPLIRSDLRVDAYTSLVRERFLAIAETKNKKEETLERACEKLVWILSIFVMALEHESVRLFALAGTQENPQDDGSSIDLSASPVRKYSSGANSLYHHSAKDYADAARSVAKILFDFVKKNLDPSTGPKNGTQDYNAGQIGLRGRKKGPPSPENTRRQPGAAGMQQSDSTILHDKPLLQIGDVLHRTRTFLVDPTSPPAALLRGELIAFLCDVLDIDMEMELSEEEAVTATAGDRAGPITDLGSAGSLLKLIVLNCSIMRSPECESLSSLDGNTDPEQVKELRRHVGSKANLDGADVHRLHAGNRFLSVVHRLAASRSTSARITACSLGPVLWGHLDFPHQLQLRGVITRALHDAEVIVRKSTATVLHEIAELVFDQRAVPWLILMCERAMTDPEPQLRSAAMTLTWHLAEHLPNAFLGDASQGSRFLRRLPNRSDPVFADVYLLQCKLLPVATRLAEDRAPSVRLAVAAQSDRLCSALGDHWSSVIVDALLALLTDSDERVRCEAVLCVPRMAEIVLMSKATGSGPITDVSVLESLLPAALMLQKDKVPQVRVALATSAGELLTLLVSLQSFEEISSSAAGEQETEPPAGSGRLKRHVDDVLIPLVQNLLHDKDPEVTSSALRAVTNASRGTVREIRNRKNTLASEDDASVSSHRSLSSNKDRNEPVFTPVLSEAQVVRLFPTLLALGDSKQWRVRQSSVEIVPALLGCTRNMDTRREISHLCVRLMSDHVDAVRRTAAECLCLGGGSLGSHGEGAGAEWITSVVVPHVRRCAVHSNAKQRLLSLKMIEVVLLNGACPAKWKGDEEGERLADSPMRELAVVALSLANDNVPNVRLNVGRVIETVIHVLEEETLTFVKEVLLQQLGSEQERPGGGDRDVIYFASRAVHKARVILEEISFTATDELLDIN